MGSEDIHTMWQTAECCWEEGMLIAQAYYDVIAQAYSSIAQGSIEHFFGNSAGG